MGLRGISRASGLTLALLLMTAPRGLAAEQILIDGSNGVRPLVAALVEAYRERQPDIAIEIGKGLGAKARLEALAAGKIDIAMASHGVVPEEIAPELSRIAGALAPGGRVYFSGILESEVGRALQAMERHGLQEVGGRAEGEWVAVIAERTP